MALSVYHGHSYSVGSNARAAAGDNPRASRRHCYWNAAAVAAAAAGSYYGVAGGY